MTRNAIGTGMPIEVIYGGTGQSAPGAPAANGIGALAIASNLSDLANAATARTNLGLGTAATAPATDFAQTANNLSDLSNAILARANLGLGTAATFADTDFAQTANNLSDLANTATALANLGGAASATTITINGTAAEIDSSAGAQDLSANRTWTLSLPIALTFTGKTITGGTYASASATLFTFTTGTIGTAVTGVTQAPATNNTTIATTAYVDAAVAGGGGGAPTTATYITQTPDAGLSNEQALSLLATGLLKSTTATGVISIAVQGTDYYEPGGTDVALIDGGTGASLVASNGGIFYSTGAAGAILAGTATAGQMLQSGASSAPAWSTATWPATTTINQILYSNANNVVVGLATVNSGLLVTSAGGVPSIATAIPNGVTATTQAALTNNTTVATTSYVDAAVAAGGGGGGSASLGVTYLVSNGIFSN